MKGHRQPDDGSRRDSQWNFQGFLGKTYEPYNFANCKRKAESLADVFHGQRYRVVDEAIPLDDISRKSDHIYAEIEDETNKDTHAPCLPPRADTPISNEAPDYPPYSSREVRLRRTKSERKALYKNDSIVISHY